MTQEEADTAAAYDIANPSPYDQNIAGPEDMNALLAGMCHDSRVDGSYAVALAKFIDGEMPADCITATQKQDASVVETAPQSAATEVQRTEASATDANADAASQDDAGAHDDADTGSCHIHFPGISSSDNGTSAFPPAEQPHGFSDHRKVAPYDPAQ